MLRLVCFSVWLRKGWVLLLCLQLCSASSTSHQGNTQIRLYEQAIPPHPLTERAPKHLSPLHSPYTHPHRAKPAHLPHMTLLPSRTTCYSCQRGERHPTTSKEHNADTKDIKQTSPTLNFLALFETCSLYNFPSTPSVEGIIIIKVIFVQFINICILFFLPFINWLI